MQEDEEIGRRRGSGEGGCIAHPEFSTGLKDAPLEAEILM
jgi:hypothetical protein